MSEQQDLKRKTTGCTLRLRGASVDDLVVGLAATSSQSLQPRPAVTTTWRIWQKSLKEFCAPANCKGHEIRTDVSIGIAVAPDHGSNVEDLLKRADLAMYAAKSEGRGTYRFYAPEYDAKAKQRRQLELDLRQALSRGEFEIHYQPLVDLGTNTVTGCEALLRWHHPERGLVSPAEFIPIAEETGLISEIGEWALKTACEEAVTWLGQIRIAVNVCRSNSAPRLWRNRWLQFLQNPVWRQNGSSSR